MPKKLIFSPVALAIAFMQRCLTPLLLSRKHVEPLSCPNAQSGKIKKPLVAWCIGTCAKLFPFEVQFGHAGACATKRGETASEKNAALAAAGAVVPAR